MEVFDQGFKDILSSEIISIFGGLFAGFLLAIYTNQLLLIPGMLVLLPGFLEMRGNISGSFASRLSSGLLLGVINPNRVEKHVLYGNLFASFFLVIMVSFFLGMIALLFNYFVLGIFVWKILWISLLAALLANLIEIPSTYFTTLWLFKKGHDPNNIMGPFVSTTGDIVSIVALLVAIVVVA